MSSFVKVLYESIYIEYHMSPCIQNSKAGKTIPCVIPVTFRETVVMQLEMGMKMPLGAC